MVKKHFFRRYRTNHALKLCNTCRKGKQSCRTIPFWRTKHKLWKNVCSTHEALKYANLKFLNFFNKKWTFQYQHPKYLPISRKMWKIWNVPYMCSYSNQRNFVRFEIFLQYFPSETFPNFWRPFSQISGGVILFTRIWEQKRKIL